MCYWLVVEQICYVECLGFDSVWIVQYYFYEQEGGLFLLLVFFVYVVVQIDWICFGMVIIILLMENLLCVVEDVVVLDLFIDGCLEVGFGFGGMLILFLFFGLISEQCGVVFVDYLYLIYSVWCGDMLSYLDNCFYLLVLQLVECIWIVIFLVEGVICVGQVGYGLMLFCIQLWLFGELCLLLDVIQNLIIDVYLVVLLDGVVLWIFVLCIVFVVDSFVYVLQVVEFGLCKQVIQYWVVGYMIEGDSVIDYL